jgi:triacylglycerol lipase
VPPKVNATKTGTEPPRAAARPAAGRTILLAALLMLALPSPASARWTATSSVVHDRALHGCVVLLHGLGRTEASMERLAEALAADGYTVANVGYPSRSASIAQLAEPAVNGGLEVCREAEAVPVHFVTHSLGGILLRQYLADHDLPDLGRTVMLAPPNQGSEAADAFRDLPGFGLLTGEAGYELGTGDESVPLSLGPVDFDVGVIAGDKTIDPVSSLVLPDPDDGKVSVARTRVEGMRDFIVLGHSHAFIMRNDETIRQVRHYLLHGRFDHGAGDGQ